MTLNEKIGVILKQHKEGEEFFNALDFMIKGDRSILEDFLSFFMNDAGKKLNLGDTGLIVSGGFGNAIMTMYGDRLTENFREVIVTNGGIRLGNEALIFKDKLLCKNWIFIDDSYYLEQELVFQLLWGRLNLMLHSVRLMLSMMEVWVEQIK